jgi:hypothetical protein
MHKLVLFFNGVRNMAGLNKKNVVTDRKFDNYRKCYTQFREFVRINNVLMDVKEVISSGDN